MSYFGQIALHILIGILIYLNEGLAKIYFFVILGYFLYRITLSSHDNSKTYEVLKACAYFVGAEVFLRTARGAISYEAVKYIVMLFMLIGMLYKGLSGRGYPYFIYMMLLVPSIFVASTTLSFDANFRTNIAFVLSGPICLGIAALFCYDKRVTFGQMSNILYLMVLPIVSHVVYIFFYNPSVKEVISTVASNRTASGGWGANQVSAVLGLGMLIMVIRLFTSSPSNRLKLVNALILVAMSYRALVTFSRGGVITALITIVVFLVFFYIRSSETKRNEILGVFIFICVSFSITWMVSVNQTSGLINLRYENKDSLGREKSDFTTGRGELFKKELDGFIGNPFLGIGSSRAKDQRIEEEGQGVTSHSEVSRTLAEHGIFGVLILLILIFKPLSVRYYNRENYYFYPFLFFWFLTINHMSMRLAMPAFIYALALLRVVNDPVIIYRKQIAPR